MAETGSIGHGVSFSIGLPDGGPPSRGLEVVFDAARQASSFGTATSDNGAKMFGHIPHVAPEAWFHILFPALDEAELRDLDTALRRSVPGSYREFLKVFNGLHLFGGKLALNGLRLDYSRKPGIRLPFDLADANVHERPRAAHPSWFIFAFYREDGSRAYMDPADGRVYRGTRDLAEARLNEWESLDRFLESEVTRMAPLFDERGHQLDKSQSTTPLVHSAH
jgi:hypothetical protein